MGELQACSASWQQLAWVPRSAILAKWAALGPHTMRLVHQLFGLPNWAAGSKVVLNLSTLEHDG